MLSIKVDNLRQHTVYTHDSGEISLGRQPSASGPCVVIDDDYVSRRQLRILELSPDGIKFENLGGNPLHTSDGRKIGLGEIALMRLPASVHIGNSRIRFEWTRAKHDALQDTVPGIPQLRLGTTLLEPPGGAPSDALGTLGEAPSAEKLTYWFETLLLVQHAAVGSTEFYRETAEAIVKLVGLDRGLVVLKRADGWDVVAGSAATGDTPMSYSKTILEKVESSRQTVYGNPLDLAASESLNSVEAVVAAPIFNREKDLIGMLYGSRDLKQGMPHYSITPLEAHVVQLLACSITAGYNRQQMEQQLEKSEQLAAVGQALGYILHDLRGPLGNTRQLTEMLRSNDTQTLTREQQLDYIQESVEIASDLLSDSLEYCRGTTRVEPVRGTFHDLFAKHLRLIELSLEGRPVTLKVQVPDRLDIWVDSDRMARVLRNLVKNAAEALGDRADAVITIGGSQDVKGTRLWVADNGAGLSAEVRDKLFEPFATQGKSGGTGFGLAIAHQLVAAHQGSITVESGPRGTRFVITLPNPKPEAPVVQHSPRVAQADTPPPTPKSPQSTHVSPSAKPRIPAAGEHALHVLLAEDMLINQRLVKGLLERLGHTVVIVGDGREAVEAWRTQEFDAVLMDIEMPHLDGLAACRAIRQAERQGHRIPIIGLSGHETPEVMEKCQTAGMDGYIPKPIRPAILEEVLGDVRASSS